MGLTSGFGDRLTKPSGTAAGAEHQGTTTQ